MAELDAQVGTAGGGGGEWVGGGRTQCLLVERSKVRSATLEAAYKHIWKNSVSTGRSSSTIINVQGTHLV